ncbi:hypothetical protein XPA_009892 [Xanthoria parietina]
MMAAYHESRVKALSEYYALCHPNTPRVIHFGRSSDAGWQSRTIDTVEVVEDQRLDTGGHFQRQISHVSILPGHHSVSPRDSEDDYWDGERATPEIAKQTLVEIAEIEQGSIIGTSARNPIVLRQTHDTASPISGQHIRFRCFGGIWMIEDLGSASGTIVNGICIQGRRQSSSSRSSSKRSFSTLGRDIHYSFSATLPPSQSSDAASSKWFSELHYPDAA